MAGYDARSSRVQTAPPQLLLTKLRAPNVRDGMLARSDLTELLRRRPNRCLTIVVAPTGSGKTTLLSTWSKSAAMHEPVGWVTLDSADDDPVVLWSHVIEALRRVCPPVGKLSPATVATADVRAVILPRLVNVLAEQHGVSLVLDDFQRLSNVRAREDIAWLIEHAPASLRLILSTRTEPALPLAALRARGELCELRAEDLWFSASETQEFLNGQLGLGLDPRDVDTLYERTDGWPAGLYLAALSLQHAEDRHALVTRFDATSRHVVDLFIEEVLDAHAPEMRRLMLRTSILDRFSGPLCDAVLEQQGTAAKLDELARTNLFLSGPEGEGSWYRFHQLFAQLLRIELELREPELVATLHRRASAWHREHGTPDEAIHHALEAGAFRDAADLIAAAWVSYANRGRYATVLAWLERIPEEHRRADARLLLVEAWILSMSGRADETAPLIDAVERHERSDGAPLPDGFASIEASLALLQAVFTGGDVGAQLERALLAADLVQAGSPWRPVACWAVGWGSYYHGRFDVADRWFEDSAALAPESGQWVIACSSLAHRSLIAGQQGRLEDQRVLAEQAEELIREREIESLAGASRVALAASLADRGRAEEGLPLIESALEVLRAWGQPIQLAMALLCQASLLRQCGERERSDLVAAEVGALLEACADPGILREQLMALRPARRPAGEHRAALTEREASILRLLSGSLTEREIARELYLSHNTVHTHIRSIYRKLGVSSRAEAVAHDRARARNPAGDDTDAD